MTAGSRLRIESLLQGWGSRLRALNYSCKSVRFVVKNLVIETARIIGNELDSEIPEKRLAAAKLCAAK
jgi:hypothetical protein